MRGKVVKSFEFSSVVGITPAHAGKSMPLKPFQNRPEDHPRTCGEKNPTYLLCFSLEGSPPHMRGKVIIYTVIQTV